MTQMLEAKGGTRLEGYLWQDPGEWDDIAKIYVRGGPEDIQSIQFEYVKDGQTQAGFECGGSVKGFTETFEIDLLNGEYLVSVDGYYNSGSGKFQALQFKTNFRASGVMGYDIGTKFSLAVEGKKIFKYHAIAGQKNIYSLGAYFTWTSPTRLEPQGRKGGVAWDDGVYHEGVTKIYVWGGRDGVQCIKFDYVMDGKPKEGSSHGLSIGGFTELFEINHLIKEYLVSVEGYYDDVSGVIQALCFNTNIRSSNKLIGYVKGSKFIIGANGKKIIGFHGSAENSLNSLGVYLKSIPIIRLEAQGGPEGRHWDDGGNYNGIRKVYILDDIYSVLRIVFDYDKGGNVVTREHGAVRGHVLKEFMVDYPDEFISSVQGTWGNTYSSISVISLSFTTSKGRTSPVYGNAVGHAYVNKFVLESKGNVLVGFHGLSTDTLLFAIGAYFAPPPLFPAPRPPVLPLEKLEAQGGDGGISWDDGGDFNGVKKIFVGLSENGVAFVKFMYFKSLQIIFGDDHGNKTLLHQAEFELDYFEHIVSVEGSYDDKSGAITMLRFNTNKKPSPDFGVATTSTFLLQKDDHKIVGFHGKSSNMFLHQIGVHVLPMDFKFFPLN